MPKKKKSARAIEKPPFLSKREVKAVRKPGAGATMLPPRCYHSEAIYRFEVEKIFKRNWLAVGRWDQVEKPGDYLTIDLFGEPVLVVRDLQGELHALINVCRHRWTKIMEGRGNTDLLTCPYHRWTYNLDGSLRGVAGGAIEGFDKSSCRLPELAVEIWQGFVFVNFDANARPLAPRLEYLDGILDHRRLSEYRMANAYTYEAPWNWKFSFENGGEAYHHLGIHHDRINHILPANLSYTGETGELFFTYYSPGVPGTEDFQLRLGVKPPQMTEADEKELLEKGLVFIGIYPNLIFFCGWERSAFIIFEHDSVDANRATTAATYAPHTQEHPDFEQFRETLAHHTKAVQEEDNIVCRRLQQGVTSSYNEGAILHPLERGQLSHFHNWLVDQYLAG